ncbi:hypothetical protein Xoosp14_127 [Xanthomonas phage Xoo-sp14]|nr:hypothetical protein Xoosp14_127 [Xanthomonas phage Xoo-sp14]
MLSQTFLGELYSLKRVQRGDIHQFVRWMILAGHVPVITPATGIFVTHFVAELTKIPIARLGSIGGLDDQRARQCKNVGDVKFVIRSGHRCVLPSKLFVYWSG